MRNAGRDDRQRVERLYQVGLRKAKAFDGSNGRSEPHSMAGSAIATFVACVVLARISAMVMRVDVGICVMARSRSRVAMIMVIACGDRDSSN